MFTNSASAPPPGQGTVSSTAAAEAMLELEALVRLASRTGHLDPELLLPAYDALSRHHYGPGAGPRGLCHEAWERALAALPADVLTAPRIMIAGSLAGFDVQPIPTEAPGPGTGYQGLIQAGRFADGGVLLAAPTGEPTLLAIAFHLTALLHTWASAKRLLAQAGRGVHGDDPASIAFALGLTESQLAHLEAMGSGGLLHYLGRERLLPAAVVHADVHPDRQRARGQQAAQQLLATLAELGLLQRPVHLWLGPSAPVDCLSPYTRELRGPLARWGARGFRQLRDASGLLVDFEKPSEDLLYWLAETLHEEDAGLADERERADQTVGISHHVLLDGDTADIVDTARLDPYLVDVRLGSLPTSPPTAAAAPGRRVAPAPAPVIVRCPATEGPRGAAMLEAMLAGFGARLSGVTLALEGALALSSERSGGAYVPDLWVDWSGGGRATCLPAAGPPLSPSAIGRHLGSPVGSGGLLSLPHSALFSVPVLQSLQASHGVQACDVGSGGLLAVLQSWALSVDGAGAVAGAGASTPSRVAWVALVASDYGEDQRPTLAMRAAQSAVALAVLEVVLGQRPARAPAPRPSTGGDQKRRKPGTRSGGKGVRGRPGVSTRGGTWHIKA